MKKLLSLILFILFFTLTTPVWAATYYVRPARSGPYGDSSGTSYANAFNGLEGVIWSSYDNAANTFYVCGEHTLDDPAGHGTGTVSLSGGAGDADNQRQILRGDCSSVDASYDDGVVWGAQRHTTAWTSYGNNVWYHDTPGNSSNTFSFYWPNDGTYGRMTRASSLTDLESKGTSAYGYFWNTTDPDRTYVKMPDLSQPNGNVLTERYGYTLDIAGENYITFYKLDILNVHGTSGGGDMFNVGYNTGRSATYITWDGCKIMYSHQMIVTAGDNCDNWKIINSELAYGKEGAYYATTTNGSTPGPDNGLFQGNYVHDVGTVNYGIDQGDPDAHGFGYWGNGSNWEVSDNRIDNCGSGITIYPAGSYTMSGWRILRNWIENGHTNGGANSRGIEWNGNDNVPGTAFSDNVVAYNVVENMTGSNADLGICYRSKIAYSGTTPSVEFYNNIGSDCYITFQIQLQKPSESGECEYGFHWKNNISLNPRAYHVYGYNNVECSPPSADIVEMGSNIYYGTTNTWRWFRPSDNGYTEFTDLASFATRVQATTNDTDAEDDSVTTDPDLTSAHRVQTTSTNTIDQGLNLAAECTECDDGLDLDSVWPTGINTNSVATLDQDLYGSGWEIGAFVRERNTIGKLIPVTITIPFQL